MQIQGLFLKINIMREMKAIKEKISETSNKNKIYKMK